MNKQQLLSHSRANSMKSHVEKGDYCVQAKHTLPHPPSAAPPWGRNLGRKRVFVGPPKEKIASKGVFQLHFRVFMALSSGAV